MITINSGQGHIPYLFPNTSILPIKLSSPLRTMAKQKSLNKTNSAMRKFLPAGIN